MNKYNIRNVTVLEKDKVCLVKSNRPVRKRHEKKKIRSFCRNRRRVYERKTV